MGDGDGDGVGTPAADASQPNDFEYGLCECFANIDFCLLSCFCPCIQYGWNWAMLDEEFGSFPKGSEGGVIWCLIFCAAVTVGDATVPCLSVFLHFWTRLVYRRVLNKRERLFYDCFSALCCRCCMLAQDGNNIRAHMKRKASDYSDTKNPPVH